jgi:transporter family protein
VKNVTALSLIIVLQVAGNILLSRGMRQVGGLGALTFSSALTFGLHTLANPYVLAGAALLGAFFVCYLAALTWLDLSYVLPMTAATYVLTALFAWLVLNEAVPATRWAGTIAVTIGILLVGDNERRRKKEL